MLRPVEMCLNFQTLMILLIIYCSMTFCKRFQIIETYEAPTRSMNMAGEERAMTSQSITEAPPLSRSRITTPTTFLDGRSGGTQCGNHVADSCQECPFDLSNNGNKSMGASWCNGVCKWKLNKCVSEKAVRCGGHYAKTCEKCPEGGYGKSWCHGDCEWKENENGDKCKLKESSSSEESSSKESEEPEEPSSEKPEEPSSEESSESEWGRWGGWGKCSRSCEKGTKKRERKCPIGKRCTSDETTETESCNNYNCKAECHGTPFPIIKFKTGGYITDKEDEGKVDKTKVTAINERWSFVKERNEKKGECMRFYTLIVEDPVIVEEDPKPNEKKNKFITEEDCTKCFEKTTKTACKCGENKPALGYPWIVTLIDTDTNKVFCQATLVARNYVITANDCINKNEYATYTEGEIKVRFGHDDNDEKNEDIGVDKMEEVSLNNERIRLRIIKLKQKVDTEKFYPICLEQFSSDGTKFSKLKAWIYGWETSKLKEKEVKVVKIDNTNILKVKSKLEFCKKDKGGPLVVRSRSETRDKYVLIGVGLSGQGETCQENVDDVENFYYDVSTMTTVIEAKLKKMEGSSDDDHKQDIFCDGTSELQV